MCSKTKITDKYITSDQIRAMHPILTWVISGTIFRHLKAVSVQNLFINAFYMSTGNKMSLQLENPSILC